MERIIYGVVGTVLGAAVGTFGYLCVMNFFTIPRFNLAAGACGAIGAVIVGTGGALLGAKFVALILATVLGSVLGACGSIGVAPWLFTLNAPDADSDVRGGFAFQLYISLVAGGIMGALTAAGVVSGSSAYCIYFGAITTIVLLALILPGMIVLDNSGRDIWEIPDLLALPLLLAIVLLAWGVKLHTR